MIMHASTAIPREQECEGAYSENLDALTALQPSSNAGFAIEIPSLNSTPKYRQSLVHSPKASSE